MIDKHDVSGNNCTTVTCKVLKEAGSNIFNFDSLLFGKKIYSYEEDFTIPISLQNFLEEQKEANKNISDATELMKKHFLI